MSQELYIAEEWQANQQSVVIAIVERTWGSAPRRAGSMMVIRGDGTFEGSVSGGCVEGAVISEALSLIETKTPCKTLTFSVASEDAWQVGLACGGEITIRLFQLVLYAGDGLASACTALRGRKMGVLVFDSLNEKQSFEIANPSNNLQKPRDEDHRFILPLYPALRLDIIGAVHIAQHLSVMAAECDFTVRIIDPRALFTENRQFGAAEMISQWPDDFLNAHMPDASNAVVTLTHDPKLDDAALKVALNSDAFYIGCLGGKKTHAARLSRLEAEGYSKSQLTKIHGPVGLRIGAATPAEIAASILAEMIQTARTPS